MISLCLPYIWTSLFVYANVNALCAGLHLALPLKSKQIKKKTLLFEIFAINYTYLKYTVLTYVYTYETITAIKIMNAYQPQNYNFDLM